MVQQQRVDPSIGGRSRAMMIQEKMRVATLSLPAPRQGSLWWHLTVLVVVLCSSMGVSATRSQSGNGPLDVVIIPHTHLDVGWLQTWESYYYLNVSRMLPGIVANLAEDPTKRFCWAEVVYFEKWWSEDATPKEQSILRELIQRKQFEFVDGGLVQHDQANPTARGIVNQMTSGHAFLLRAFGVVPRVGWSLDPFGSSTANAALYGLSNYDALVINRIPDSEMAPLKASKGLEFVWRPSPSLPNEQTEIFTHVLDSYFCMPGGFRWAWSQADSPWITPSNAAERAANFAGQIKPRAAWFKTNKILVPWGCDFM